jgi:hypothetical protein
MSERPPETYVPPRVVEPEEEASNALFGLGLLALSLLLFAGTIGIALVYLALD